MARPGVRSRLLPRALVAWGTLSATCPWLPAASPTDALDSFERHVRPVLVERCWRCHAGDAAEGGLRLDSRAALLAGGASGPALVPGDPAASAILDRLLHRSDIIAITGPSYRLHQSTTHHLAATAAATIQKNPPTSPA